MRSGVLLEKFLSALAYYIDLVLHSIPWLKFSVPPSYYCQLISVFGTLQLKYYHFSFSFNCRTATSAMLSISSAGSLFSINIETFRRVRIDSPRPSSTVNKSLQSFNRTKKNPPLQLFFSFSSETKPNCHHEVLWDFHYHLIFADHDDSRRVDRVSKRQLRVRR